MKHVKPYINNINIENIENINYNVNDYVLISTKDLTNDDINKIKMSYNTDYITGKIIKISNLNGANTYKCEFIYGTTFHMYRYELLRKLTPKEIEQYELEKSTYIFNI